MGYDFDAALLHEVASPETWIAIGLWLEGIESVSLPFWSFSQPFRPCATSDVLPFPRQTLWQARQSLLPLGQEPALNSTPMRDLPLEQVASWYQILCTINQRHNLDHHGTGTRNAAASASDSCSLTFLISSKRSSSATSTSREYQ